MEQSAPEVNLNFNTGKICSMGSLLFITIHHMVLEFIEIWDFLPNNTTQTHPNLTSSFLIV